MGSLRKSQYYFLAFLTLYMVTGIGALVLGNIWLNQSVAGAPRDAVISRAIEQAGTIIGGIVAGTALIGYVGALFPVRRKDFLMTFIFLLIAAVIAELSLGGIIWFKTLRMRSLFSTEWLTWSDPLKIAFQDMTSVSGYGECCGYLQGQNMVLSGACAAANAATTFPGCEEKVSAFADSYLRKLYTSLFGFTVVNVFCFVSGVILIQARNDEERYIRIGRKEGRNYVDSI